LVLLDEFAAEDFGQGTGKTDRERRMDTLYDLLGALPSDDAEGLRDAFRRAVKGAHPDLRPGDPDAGLKFRQIVRANEILGDVEQRAAYDHLLELARLEGEQAAKHAFADIVYKVASGVMAVAMLSSAVVGSYALFLHLSASGAVASWNGGEVAIREPARSRPLPWRTKRRRLRPRHLCAATSLRGPTSRSRRLRRARWPPRRPQGRDRRSTPPRTRPGPTGR
jgi:curved DNA-binding protein CbpA